MQLHFTALWALGTSARYNVFLKWGWNYGWFGQLLDGIVGGGAVAGVFVLAAPVAILAGAGVGKRPTLKIRNYHKRRSGSQRALKKHDAIINELNDKDKLSNEAIEYLNSLNILLRQAIKEIEVGFGAA